MDCPSCLRGIGELTETCRCRHKEYNFEGGSSDPLTASLTAAFGGASNILRGLGSIASETTKAVKAQNEKYAASASGAGLSTPGTLSRAESSTRSVTEAQKISGQNAGKETAQALPSTPADKSETFSSSSAVAHSDISFSTDYDPEEEAFNAPLPELTEDPQLLDLDLRLHTGTTVADSLKEGSITSASTRSMGIAGAAATGAGLGLVKGTGLAMLHAATIPLDVVAATARGLHNAPRLYGDDTVRQQDRITGVGSGLKAAGKVSHSHTATNKRGTTLTARPGCWLGIIRRSDRLGDSTDPRSERRRGRGVRQRLCKGCLERGDQTSCR